MIRPPPAELPCWDRRKKRRKLRTSTSRRMRMRIYLLTGKPIPEPSSIQPENAVAGTKVGHPAAQSRQGVIFDYWRRPCRSGELLRSERGANSRLALLLKLEQRPYSEALRWGGRGPDTTVLIPTDLTLRGNAGCSRIGAFPQEARLPRKFEVLRRRGC